MIDSTYRSVRRKTLLAATVAGVLIGIFGPFVIRVWAGPAAVPGRPLLWLMALFAVVMSATNNQALLLMATGRMGVETTVAVLAAAVNLVLSIHLVKSMGVEGVILSTVLSFLAVMILPQEWEVRRVLQGRYLPAASPAKTIA